MTMTNLEIITQKLLSPSGYVVFPVAAADLPLPVAEWEIQDANGVGTGQFYSPNSLSDIMGYMLQLVPAIGGNFYIMRYGMDWDTIINIETLFTNNGMINIRKNPDGTYKTAAELNYASFTGSEFLFIPPYMGADIPKG